MPEAEKVKLADFVINNDGKSPLISQVMAIHFKI
jgi:dephospho-CoA kinase